MNSLGPNNILFVQSASDIGISTDFNVNITPEFMQYYEFFCRLQLQHILNGCPSPNP
jgi:hypothetical protein